MRQRPNTETRGSGEAQEMEGGQRGYWAGKISLAASKSKEEDPEERPQEDAF